MGDVDSSTCGSIKIIYLTLAAIKLAKDQESHSTVSAETLVLGGSLSAPCLLILCGGVQVRKQQPVTNVLVTDPCP